MGGDLALAEEIKEIAEFNETLPDSHTLKAFNSAISTTPTTASVSQNPLPWVGIDTVHHLISPIILELQKHHQQSLEQMRTEFLQHSQQLRQEDREARKVDLKEITERIGRLEEQSTSTPQHGTQAKIPSTPAPTQGPPDYHIIASTPTTRTQPRSQEDPFESFLHHFYTLDHRSKTVDVQSLMGMYRKFATERGLPLIETRRKLLLSVSRVSVTQTD